MTKLYTYQKWRTSRTWPGGGWGEAMAQVRKDQRLSQRDIAEYVGVGLDTVRKWENGLALPDRTLWPKVEEAMGMPVPDPRVPDHTPAERELIDTILLLVDEMRLLRDRLAEIPGPAPTVQVRNSRLLDVKATAEYLGVSPGFVRNLVAQRTLVYLKLGSRVMFRKEDIDEFLDSSRQERSEATPSQLRGRRGKSPRTPVPAKPPQAPRTGRRLSKQEIADKRWTVAELGERWFGLDSAKALVRLAGIPVTEESSEQATFRYGDLVVWMEAHRSEFTRWVEEFDPSSRRAAIGREKAAGRLEK